MPQLNYTVTISGLGGNISQSTVRTDEGGLALAIPLPVGFAGALTTHTSTSVGTVTLGAGHGITTGMIVDLYWAGGIRYGVTVGTVSVDSVPITGGAGDDLPAATTAVVMTHQVVFNVAIYGDNLTLFSIQQQFAGNTITDLSHITFLDVTPLTIAEIDLEPNTPQVWDVAGGSSNPFSGNPIVTAAASNGSAIAAATLNILVLQNPTP